MSVFLPLHLLFFIPGAPAWRGSSELAGQPGNDSIYFLAHPEAMNQLDELLLPFHGQVVYLDLWASWCGPCREEFTHAAALQSFVAGKPIALLYVSLDKVYMRAHWEAMVRRNQLRGYHVLASETLAADLRDRFGYRNDKGEPVLSIPRYVIIGPDGQITRESAARPSQGKRLYRQLGKGLRKR